MTSVDSMRPAIRSEHSCRHWAKRLCPMCTATSDSGKARQHVALVDRSQPILVPRQRPQLLDQRAEGLDHAAAAVGVLADEDVDFALGPLAPVEGEPAQDALGRCLADQGRGLQPHVVAQRVLGVDVAPVVREGALGLDHQQLLEAVAHRRYDPPRAVGGVLGDGRDLLVVLLAQLTPVQPAEDQRGEHEQRPVQGERRPGWCAETRRRVASGQLYQR